MRKIRVLQFGSSNGLFGAERWILALVRYCDASQVENLIVTIKDAPNAQIDLIDKASEMGFETDLIHARGPYDPGTILSTVSLIRKHRIDIIHTHGYKSDIIGCMAAKIAGIPVISTPHGSELPNNPKLNVYVKIGDWFLKRVDLIVPVSEGLKKEYMEKGFSHEKVKVINNGVDILEVEAVVPDAKLTSEKRQNGLKIVGYIGQLIERKGLQNLIKAIKIVIEEINAKLLLIGTGPTKGELEKLAENEVLSGHVDFLGFRTDRLELLKCFDVFALPSHLEGIPRVVMEAMTAKIPVVASDIPGVRDLVSQGETGLLVPTDSPDQLAGAIIELLKDPVKTDKITLNAYEHVKTNYSAERMSGEYTELYEKLLTGKGSAFSGYRNMEKNDGT